MFDEVSLGMQHEASFGWAPKPSALKAALPSGGAAFVAKIEANEAPRLLGEGTMSTLDAAQLKQWVAKENFPLVSELTMENFKKTADSGRLLVTTFVSEQAEEKSAAQKQAMIDAAHALEPAELERFYFGSIDGLRWHKFVRNTYGLEKSDMPATLVLDSPSKMFFKSGGEGGGEGEGGGVAKTVETTAEITAFLRDVLSGAQPALPEKGGKDSSDKVGLARILSDMGWKAGFLLIPIFLFLVLIYLAFCDTVPESAGGPKRD